MGHLGVPGFTTALVPIAAFGPRQRLQVCTQFKPSLPRNVSDNDRKALIGPVNTLAEDLSTLRGKLGLN